MDEQTEEFFLRIEKLAGRMIDLSENNSHTTMEVGGAAQMAMCSVAIAQGMQIDQLLRSTVHMHKILSERYAKHQNSKKD